jgi:antitoxin component YwqK of YwqJK toxin-antitoxin module
VWDLYIKYEGYSLCFIYTNHADYKKTVGYYSIKQGGQCKYIQNYQNGQLHGIQYGWYNIQGGGHQSYIQNYQNGLLHGIQYEWWNIKNGGHQRHIQHCQNNRQYRLQLWDIYGTYSNYIF